MVRYTECRVGATLLVSAGEASGDLYASLLVDELRQRRPDLAFAGCAGPRMQRAGVVPVVDAPALAVVGLVEVVAHLPRIWREYRKLLAWVRRERPAAAILTDSPDFHLRLARRLNAMGIPVICLIAPQAWAWRKGRLPKMRRTVDRLLCIFPFEQEFFTAHGIETVYIGHPLASIVRASAPASELRARYNIPPGAPLIALLPGSRTGEVMRHLPHLTDAAEQIRRQRPDAQFILALSAGFGARADLSTFQERFSAASIKVSEGQTWDVLACADVALAASGTVTVEAALLGTPMVTFYRVTGLSWLLGRMLVRVPFYSMVNLIAGERIVPEIMQRQMTGKRLAAEALHLLDDPEARAEMRRKLQEVSRKLARSSPPMEAAADVVESYLDKEFAHVS
jgi:lipid-A-disaccharide synthase